MDQNTDRNPTSPLASLIRAVQHERPDFDFLSIDVITDRRPIRMLYAFVEGQVCAFEFGVSIVGDKTALFTRIEKRTRENGRSVGYRRGFETKYLKIAVEAKSSTSHHRVVRYILGGMTFLVRSSVDAYLRDRDRVGDSSKSESADGDDADVEGKNVKDEKEEEEELTDYVQSLSLDEPTPSFRLAQTASVVVIPGGRHIPHAATLEMSTRAKFAFKDLCARKMPDLWISQTANFLEAFHTYDLNGKDSDDGSYESVGSYNPGRGHQGRYWRGGGRSASSKPRASTTNLARFTDIRIKPLAQELAAWETANAEKLGLLIMVIKKVIGAAKRLRGTCLVTFDGKDRALKVRRAEEEKVPGLPDELRVCFVRRD